MSSVIDSMKLVFGDMNSVVKIPVAGGILYAGYRAYLGDFGKAYDINLIIPVVAGLILLGYLLQVLNNSLQEKDYVLPNMNPFPAVWYALKMPFSCLWSIVPVWFFHNWYMSVFDVNSTGLYILGAFGYILSSCLVCSSLVFFAKDFHILQGYNLLQVIKNIPDTIIFELVTVISLVIMNIIIAVPILGFVYWLFGFGKLFDYACCVVIISNLMLIFQSLSQTYFERVKLV